MGKHENSAAFVNAPVHVLYAGVTQSGKTTLARLHARLLLDNDWRVIVYDPVGTETRGGGWGKDAEVFADRERFLSYVKTQRDAFVFIDEGADLFTQGQLENQWLFRKGRHAGLYMRVCTQRPKMIAPNVRTQCAHAYLFRLAREDMGELFADFGHSRTDADAYTDLEPGDFVLLQSGKSSIDRFNAFDIVDSVPTRD